MSRLKDKYQKEIAPQLQEELGIKNKLAVPRLEKIVLNIGAGDAKDHPEVVEKLEKNLKDLSGQKPIRTYARRSIANFKLSKGQVVGLTVTLRGKRMYDFLDRLISIALPKVRDFRGMPATSFDPAGNYTFGLKEQGIFPEVDFANVKILGKIRGFEGTIVIRNSDQEKSKRLLELLGFPFRKEEK